MLGILRQKVGAGSSSAMIHPLLLQFMNFHYIKHLINLLLCDLLPNLCVGSDFGAEDPPRHVGNEGFRIFGESDQAIPEALPSRSASWGCWSWEIKSGVALCKRTIC
ncbi:uncharacterized protein LOC125476552 isoform X4 [Pyrus x bretschneideri]|uniref:uncharacterized protein LOC125476552 isoform X4 n=1 Tax=Pyrus x bretschneideri TaxID=225117 RepID=UPI00202F7FBE|nr:uncharacterized protein LOC125476552 isoform X4 [Pyrus x bretschneideri]XP_048438781.1 uncharacterized protein LOC125476552 isoform X4 [Pyrus x bretschneideri]